MLFFLDSFLMFYLHHGIAAIKWKDNSTELCVDNDQRPDIFICANVYQLEKQIKVDFDKR